MEPFNKLHSLGLSVYQFICAAVAVPLHLIPWKLSTYKHQAKTRKPLSIKILSCMCSKLLGVLGYNTHRHYYQPVTGTHIYTKMNILLISLLYRGMSFLRVQDDNPICGSGRFRHGEPHVAHSLPPRYTILEFRRLLRNRSVPLRY